MVSTLAPDILAQVLDALPMRVFWKDRESRFLGCNRLFARDAGIDDPREFVGKSDYYFFLPEQALAHREDDADVMVSGQPKLGRVEKQVRADGAVAWAEVSRFPLRDEAGGIVGIIGVYRDIAQHHRDAQPAADAV